MSFKDYQSVHEMLCQTVEKYSGQPAYRWFDGNGAEESVNWQEHYNKVKAVAKSLIALGVAKGDKVNILSYTCYRWALADMATMSIGAVTVGIYQSNLPGDCKYIINHSDSVIVFAEDQVQLAKLMEIRDEIPAIKKVVLFKGNSFDDEWVISFEDFLELGKNIPDSDFEKRTSEISPEDPAGIIYTSGTTGVPKGAVLTHDNITFTAQSVYQSADFHDGEDMFIFLPLAHVFARTCLNACILTGNRTTFARSIDTLLDDFKMAAPHWFVSVPRIFEKIHTKVISGVEAKGGISEKIFNWACRVGAEVSNCKIYKIPIPFTINFKYMIARKLVFSKIHEALGGNVKWCISGAAPLNPEIAKFFHAAGLLILEGIGMTENTSFSNVNRLDDYDFGVVGPPGPGVQHKIAEDGEVLIYGRNVMKEYYKMPEATIDTFTPDGWLRTGDIGEIDEKNVLKITGRKKDLIITSGGKNVAPSSIEGLMATSKYLNQVCVVGDQRKYLSAIVTLDEENIKAYAEDNKITYSSYEELIKNEQIVKLINGEIEKRNKELPSYETLKKISIVPEFTIENKMMTPTFKIKKNIILEQYKDEIEKMYK
ncbi:Two-component sensory box histidine kinase/response regulator protein [Desulfamplus magnetovallimortis]|uniref:Two-component sensory box histidine kinase/response regulator protein n=1 Tax=Desulfamplus magnetovallimortis TaxID=1246637 RepID=A0A1W1H6V6_9BACT|nr:long-chain fatty acid--CoA ligase [Desulfamplus magnetovallimortis]SLM28220.1 Two-component sensory box histidine kinase/response regulator protein [Desulfamplus magnetovallimortis]